MARLVGVDLPRDKRMEVALTYIFGIGRTRSNEILAATGIDRDLRTKDLTDDQLTHLRDYIEGNLKVEGDLRREVQADIRRKIEIGCYQGLRHRRGLPVRGQRTKTNARTAKAPSAPSQARRRPGNPGCHQQRRPPLLPPRRAEDAQAGKEEHPARCRSHQEHVQQHDRDDHRPAGQCHCLGVVGSRRLQGLAEIDAVRRSAGRRERRTQAQEHGVKKVDVFVKGPGSGRETAIRSLQAAGLEVGAISDVTPSRTTAAVRPSVVASSRV